MVQISRLSFGVNVNLNLSNNTNTQKYDEMGVNRIPRKKTVHFLKMKRDINVLKYYLELTMLLDRQLILSRLK